MLGFNLLLAACLAYVALLFGVAFLADRAARRGRAGWLRGPAVYTLSLSIYCTAWTFYGAVGYAARSGLEFVTIYLGPSLVLAGWWMLLRKLVRIGRSQRITSIADLISSRYGKSTFLGGLVTVFAVIGTTPYIALQLQSVTLSFGVFATPEGEGGGLIPVGVAVGLAVFTIVFGTRNLDANERHHGIVTAIALEAVVKLLAICAVGVFVVWGIAGGPAEIYAMIEASPISAWEMDASRWVGLTFLSGAAFLCLPRMFQVLVVENEHERHIATASWAFPLYLFATSLFVLPIAVVGLGLPGAGGNPDLFVLTIPLAMGRDWLALVVFLGGVSSATSMVIVATIALATMVSNHIVMPIWLRAGRQGALVSGDVRDVAILSRRLSIVGILTLGYLYYRLSGGGAALAAIGLISFVGVAQILPALLGGLFWRGATRAGAVAGLTLGFAAWAWTLFLPSFGDGTILAPATLAAGPWGIGWLRPHALFGIEGLDPVIHALIWSMIANIGGFATISLLSRQTPVERLQAAAMVDVFHRDGGAPSEPFGPVEAEDLLVMAQRILGAEDTRRLFRAEAARQGRGRDLPEPTPRFVATLERELAGSVGAATAHAMMVRITGGQSVSVEELLRVADEAAEIMTYSARLEAQSAELRRTAAELREANAKLTALSVQKDAFLSQISHELRTPMTSIRSFSEILRGPERMDDAARTRFAEIIHTESERLTRLLDDLLDLGVLESGQVTLAPERCTVGEVLDGAIAAVGDMGTAQVVRDRAAERVAVVTDPHRLAQVFINLVANFRKYCDAPRPRLEIAVEGGPERVAIVFRDNGAGIPDTARSLIFEKFSRLGDSRAAGSAGLGLAISREIMDRLGGRIACLPSTDGAAFRVELPRGNATAAAAE